MNLKNVCSARNHADDERWNVSVKVLLLCPGTATPEGRGCDAAQQTAHAPQAQHPGTPGK